MKILVINWRDIKNPEAGGAEIHIDELLKRKPAEWNVDFVSATFKDAPEKETINGYNVIRIPNNQIFNYTFKRRWEKEFKKNGYDLVIDDISKIPLATPQYIKDIPLCALHHHVHGLSLFKELPPHLASYVYYSEKLYLQAYRHTPIISVSESGKKELLSLNAYKNISVINNGIDITAFKHVSGINKTPQPTLVYLGRLKKYKRVDHVIKAYKTVHSAFPKSKLIIVGKGDDEPRLKKLVNELKLEPNIEFTGFVSEEEKVRILASSWVSAIASEKEGWGIGVIESNAAGTPVAGYKVPGLEDSIKDSYSGFLVENGKINLLAEKIELLFSNETIRKEFSANSLEWANRFSWDAAASQFYAKLNEIIAEFHKK